MSNIIRIEINQAEGDLLFEEPRTYTEWEPAARHLRELCRRKGDTPDYWKTDVTVEWDDGCIFRYRFDAQMAEFGNTADLETFRRNTLLCAKSVNRFAHPERNRHDAIRDGWGDPAPVDENGGAPS